MNKTKRPGFADQMNRLNDEFIELEIRMLRELLRFVDAHKPTRSAVVGGMMFVSTEAENEKRR